MDSRRGLLRRLAALSGAAGLSGCSQLLAGRAEAPTADLPPNPKAGTLPVAQHAWNDTLRTDSVGNHLLPRHYRLFMLGLDAEVSEDSARTVEQAMRTLEAAYEFSPEGVLHMLGWGTAYFERLGALDRSPVRKPKVLSRTDEPELLDFDAILVLASDVPSHLTATEQALFGEGNSLGDESVDARLGDVFTVEERRTGFLGEGLPAEHLDAEGLPSTLPNDAPNFTGFRAGRKSTQATEEDVTIQDGSFAGGTTIHLSHLVESLDAWWGMAESDRIDRLFSTDVTAEDVAEMDSLPFADKVREHARDEGVIGHFEKVARARKDGKPLLLRRDFNTVDGGQAGVHFLSLQRQLSDFEEVRDAMNGWWVREENTQIEDRENNGLLEFIRVVSRANFYVPPRDKRAFPSG